MITLVESQMQRPTSNEVATNHSSGVPEQSVELQTPTLEFTVTNSDDKREKNYIKIPSNK